MEENKQIVLFGSRLKTALENKNIKQKDLAKKYDYISTSLASKFFNNQKSITDIFIKLCIDENINIHWIATGNGEMYINDCNGVNVNNQNGNVAVNGTITISTKDYADSQEIQELLELLKEVPKIWIDKLLVSTKNKLKVFEEDI